MVDVLTSGFSLSYNIHCKLPEDEDQIGLIPISQVLDRESGTQEMLSGSLDWRSEKSRKQLSCLYPPRLHRALKVKLIFDYLHPVGPRQ